MDSFIIQYLLAAAAGAAAAAAMESNKWTMTCIQREAESKQPQIETQINYSPGSTLIICNVFLLGVFPEHDASTIYLMEIYQEPKIGGKNLSKQMRTRQKS